MTSINEYYLQAELALASYSTLYPGITGNDYTKALIDEVDGLSATQADLFKETYEVIDQYDGTMEKTYTDEFGQEYTYLIDTGLSVTLFEDGSGKQMVAIRGTELSDPDDVITDIIDIGLLGTARFQDQYEALSAKIQEWKDNGKLQSGFSVTGHSLGGFLATNLAMEYSADIDHTYLYNAPGLDGITGAGSVLEAIADALSPDQQFAVPGTLPITSFVASGDMVSSVGEYVVLPNLIFVEGQNPFSAHSMASLTDSIGVYNTLCNIDPSLDIETISGIFQTNSQAYQADMTLEKTVNQIADILVPTMYYVADGDREALYTTIYDLQTLFKDQGIAIDSLAGKSTTEIEFATNAAGDAGLAARYALVNLNPFTVTGIPGLYDQFNTSGQIDLYSETNPDGDLSAKYIEDRSKFLYYLTRPDEKLPEGESTIQFTDERLGIKTLAWKSGTGVDTTVRDYFWGTEGSDTFGSAGNTGADHLYGMGGDDTIKKLENRNWKQDREQPLAIGF